MELNQVLELVRAVSASNLTAFQYEEGNQKIFMQAGNVMLNGNISEICPQDNPDEKYIMTHGAAIPDAAGSDVQSGSVPAGNKAAANNNAPAGAATQLQAPEGNLIKAPLVGRFYTAPSEDAEAFVKVGDHVEKGQTLAIIEAMKLMNEIESEYDGVVAEILADNGQGVEYGQALFRIV